MSWDYKDITPNTIINRDQLLELYDAVMEVVTSAFSNPAALKFWDTPSGLYVVIINPDGSNMSTHPAAYIFGKYLKFGTSIANLKNTVTLQIHGYYGDIVWQGCSQRTVIDYLINGGGLKCTGDYVRLHFLDNDGFFENLTLANFLFAAIGVTSWTEGSFFGLQGGSNDIVFYQFYTAMEYLKENAYVSLADWCTGSSQSYDEVWGDGFIFGHQEGFEGINNHQDLIDNTLDLISYAAERF